MNMVDARSIINNNDNGVEAVVDESTQLLVSNTDDQEDNVSTNRSQKTIKGSWHYSSVVVMFALIGSFSLHHILHQMKQTNRNDPSSMLETNISGRSDMPSTNSRVGLLGKIKANGKDGSNKKNGEDCGDRRHTLALAAETPFAALFHDLKGQTKFEASSVILDGHDAYAICDSSWAISKFSDTLVPFEIGNLQIGDPYRESEDSGYEALVLQDGIFYTIRESIEMEKSEYHAIVEELQIVGDGDDYDILAACPTEFEFEGDSKGFEGAIAIRDTTGAMVLLGLCEGNHCSEKRKADKGHGKVVAMAKTVLDDGSCQWSTLKKINIPKSADFEDYSAITMDATTGRVAISSQEESQVWIGQLLGQIPGGLWDLDALEFDENVGDVYDFPKNDKCETVYCNIEGITLINDSTILAVSDKMKSKQDFSCFAKDQSAHLFVIPP